jgi:hypothetical protein
MDVAADDAVEAALPHVVDDGILEIENELQRGLHPPLGVARQGPVAGNAEQATQARQPAVDPDQQVVGHVAQDRHPAVMTGHLVEIVAMDQQEATAVDGFMHVFTFHPDVAESGFAVIAQGLVVVARHEYHGFPMARALQDFLDHGVLGRTPVDAPAHAPEIDDVAHQEQMAGWIFTQEGEQAVGLARPCAQMEIRYEDGADGWHVPRI